MQTISRINRKSFNLQLHKLKTEIDAKISGITAIALAIADRLDFICDELEKTLTENESTLYNIEFIEQQHKLFKCQKELYEAKQDLKNWNEQILEWGQYCDENFDDYLVKARQIAKGNMMLRTTLLQYNNPANDKILKIEFYLWLCNIIEKGDRKK
jgi:hypothetical protein